MDTRGFSLIELIVTVTIIGILALVLGASFTGSMASGRIEGQVKQIYADLTNARARAMQRNRIHFVTVAANSYAIFEDTNQNGVLDAAPADTPMFGAAKLLQDPLLAGVGTLTFNTLGLINGPGIIQVDTTGAGTVTVDYDCIALAQTRIKMGRMNGLACQVK